MISCGLLPAFAVAVVVMAVAGLFAWLVVRNGQRGSEEFRRQVEQNVALVVVLCPKCGAESSAGLVAFDTDGDH